MNFILLTVGHRERRLFGQPSPNRTHRAAAAAAARHAGRRGRETTGGDTGSADRDAPGGRPGGGRQGGERRGVDADGRGDAGQGREVRPEAVEPREGTGADADAGSRGVLGHLGRGALMVKQRKTDYNQTHLHEPNQVVQQKSGIGTLCYSDKSLIGIILIHSH